MRPRTVNHDCPGSGSLWMHRPPDSGRLRPHGNNTRRTREGSVHMSKKFLGPALAFGLVAAVFGGSGAGQTARPVAIDADDIGGTVTGPRGPEAGVWVIAETTNLPTRLIRSVVTDDQGRYVLPDLPTARYDVWVRG